MIYEKSIIIIQQPFFITPFVSYCLVEMPNINLQHLFTPPTPSTTTSQKVSFLVNGLLLATTGFFAYKYFLIKSASSEKTGESLVLILKKLATLLDGNRPIVFNPHSLGNVLQVQQQTNYLLGPNLDLFHTKVVRLNSQFTSFCNQFLEKYAGIYGTKLEDLFTVVNLRLLIDSEDQKRVLNCLLDTIPELDLLTNLQENLPLIKETLNSIEFVPEFMRQVNEHKEIGSRMQACLTELGKNPLVDIRARV